MTELAHQNRGKYIQRKDFTVLSTFIWWELLVGFQVGIVVKQFMTLDFRPKNGKIVEKPWKRRDKHHLVRSNRSGGAFPLRARFEVLCSIENRVKHQKICAETNKLHKTKPFE